MCQSLYPAAETTEESVESNAVADTTTITTTTTLILHSAPLCLYKTRPGIATHHTTLSRPPRPPRPPRPGRVCSLPVRTAA